MKPLSGMPLFIVTVALSLATFMIVLDYSIANVSIPYISGDLAVSTDQGTYVITAFAVGNSISLPITGMLTKKIGAVKLIILSLCFSSSSRLPAGWHGICRSSSSPVFYRDSSLVPSSL